MHMLLALLTFIFFIALDFVLSKRREAREAEAEAPVPAQPSEIRPEPVWVAGYQLPEDLHYHPGHTWARVRGDRVVVGVDDFSTKLIGRATDVGLPSVGSWQEQGAAAFRVRSNGRTAELLSPVDGEVVAVNEDLRDDPAACSDDPYGRGWLLMIKPSKLAANLRGLLSGGLARLWTEDAREQLEMRLMALSGSVLQDGGEPAADFAKHLDQASWDELVESFLLTPPPRV